MQANQDLWLVSIDPDLREIFEGYLSKKLAEFGGIQTLVDQGKFRDIEFIGHKFAGNAGSFELGVLGKKGLDLEEAARARDAKRVLELSSELFQALKRVRPADAN